MVGLRTCDGSIVVSVDQLPTRQRGKRPVVPQEPSQQSQSKQVEAGKVVWQSDCVPVMLTLLAFLCL